jgi:HK97 family phage major capsid protein
MVPQIRTTSMSHDMTNFRELRSRAAVEGGIQMRHAEVQASHFSLRELINGMMEYPQWSANTEAIASAYELSNACRERTGIPPNGIWVPLASLARNLTVGNSNALTTGVIDNKLQAALSPVSAVMAGATLLSGLGGASFSIPVMDSTIDTESNWIGEGDVGDQRELNTRLMTLEPKSLIFSVVVSRRLLANASVDLESELRKHILRRAMLAIDRAALNGVGGNAPSGLLANEDLQVLSAGDNGLAPSWDHLVEAEYQVSNRAGSMIAPTFLSSPAMRKKLRKTPRGAGLDFILSDNVDTVMGQPLHTSAMVPDNLTKGTSEEVCSALIFGDLAEIVVGFWGPLAVDLLVDSRTLAREAKVKITCRVEVGVGVRNIGAFAAYKDLLAA